MLDCGCVELDGIEFHGPKAEWPKFKEAADALGAVYFDVDATFFVVARKLGALPKLVMRPAEKCLFVHAAERARPRYEQLQAFYADLDERVLGQRSAPQHHSCVETIKNDMFRQWSLDARRAEAKRIRLVQF